jgi:D-arabinose 1-dehydrogenase-like Zn-dependent alcohol dehydrogenase
MCGGATVWNTLRKYGLSSTSTVGILGVGGLGHLAIQCASGMGMKVVVLSTTDKKKEEALSMGASDFIVTQDKKKIDIGSSKLDALLVTSSVQIEWDSYLPLLNPQSIIIPLTVHFGNFSVPQFPLLAAGIRVQGTVITSRSEMNNMLALTARTDVRPRIMSFPLNKNGNEDSIKILSERKMRYRGVLVAE